MGIRICVAGATGWAGRAIVQGVLRAEDLNLVGAVARRAAGSDLGTALGGPPIGVRVVSSVEEALTVPTDVLVDYTAPQAVKGNIRQSLEHGVRVVVGTSGLTGDDYEEIGALARDRGLGVIASGNFSVTAALAKHFSLLAAAYLPSWEIVEYASASKPDAPSGTARELAEALEGVRRPEVPISREDTLGVPEARGASVSGTAVHSVRLPGYVIAFETLFGVAGERLTIRHDAGDSAEPYVFGTLLAARKVMEVQGLIRGLDRLLFA